MKGAGVIVQLRICVPGELSAATLRACQDQLGTAGVALVPGASVIPPGDVIEVQVARESVEELMEKLEVEWSAPARSAAP